MDFSAFDSDATIGEFLDEARANMATVNRRLLEAERSDLPTEAINEIFRGAHSLKGLAGMFNLTPICETTHALETVFDRIRKGKLGFTPAVLQAAFEAVDLIGALLDDLAEKRGEDRGIGTAVLHLKELAPVASQASSSVFAPWQGLPSEVLPVFAGVDLGDLAIESRGKPVWLLRIPVQELLSRQRDLVQTWIELERALPIRAVRVLGSGEASPFAPLECFQWQLGILVVPSGDLQEALAPLVLPRHEGWRLDLSARSGERQVFLPLPSALPTGCLLVVKEGMAQHLTTWLGETREELESLDGALLGLERDPQATEALQSAFRMAHRIKGSAATMGLDPVARIAHNLEWAMDLLRSGRLAADGSVIEAMLAVKDWLANAVLQVEHGDTALPDLGPVEAALAALGERAEPAPTTLRIARRCHFPLEQVAAARARLAADETVWLASLELRHDCRLPDLRCLLALSHVEKAAVVVACLPSRSDLERGAMPGSVLHLLLISGAQPEVLRDCLYVDEVLRCDVAAAPEGQVPAVATAVPAAETPTQVASAAKPPAPEVPEPTTAIAALEPVATAPVRAAQPGPDHAAPVANSVRVEAHRLDQLMNIAGELVVAKARIALLGEQLVRRTAGPGITELNALLDALSGSLVLGFGPERLARLRRWAEGQAGVQDTLGELSEAVVGLHRSTSTLQANAMQMRMVPVAPLFQRFHRVIRDLCRGLGKQARLETSGEGTELDKKLIDDLVDPLTHLVRNALDHGLEPAEDRSRAGKPELGAVTLAAYQEGGQICIRVSDDGRGIDPVRIRAKAVEKGVITQVQADAMDDATARNLIFLPGFSTAIQVSNVSGRGVGMDIVRAKIAELKGVVEITSTIGAGTTFVIRLPLTLAMIKALLVRIGGERFALPLDAVREIVEIDARRIRRVEAGRSVIPLRDRYIAVADLPTAIGLRPHDLGQGTLRAVITKGGREPVAIPVDAVLREEEIVVKPLPGEFAKVRGLAGASILGDGGIALIIDVLAATRAVGHA